MNVNDIVQQVVRMQGLMPEVNRTTVAVRFRDMITESMKCTLGDDDERTLNWVNVQSSEFMQACNLTAPRAPISSSITAPSSVLAGYIDRWESVDMWRQKDGEEWKPMSPETMNVKATMLHSLRELISIQRAKPVRVDDQPLLPTPEYCSKFPCCNEKKPLENREGFMCCPICGASYGTP